MAILLGLLDCVFVPTRARDGGSLLAPVLLGNLLTPVILVLQVFASLLDLDSSRLNLDLLVALRLDSFPVVGSVLDLICFYN